MSTGIVGTKVGMTRLFDESGASHAVTVINVEANRIVEVKTSDNNGYSAVQVTVGSRRASRVTKPLAGHFAKAGVTAGAKTCELRLSDNLTTEQVLEQFKPGESLTAEQFSEGAVVDVTAISKGKGFAGVVKRHNFRTQDASHGNSLSHRVHGSTGQNQTPGKVFKGKKMAGQLGNKRCTIQNLTVLKVDADRQLLLVKGSIPGATGSFVVVKPAVKAKDGGEKDAA